MKPCWALDPTTRPSLEELEVVFANLQDEYFSVNFEVSVCLNFSLVSYSENVGVTLYLKVNLNTLEIWRAWFYCIQLVSQVKER